MSKLNQTRLAIWKHTIRYFSEQNYTPGRYNFSPRQQTYQQPIEEEDGAAMEDPGKKKYGLQSVPMNPPVSNPNQPTNVFPEESFQKFDIETFPGLSAAPFSDEVAKVLQMPLEVEDIEIKPDGAIYLPEVKYRKILSQAFGPGGWAMIPRGPHSLNGITLSREYALFCCGRFMSQARGSANVLGLATAASSTESVRSNALMRCCKDLGIASELWDRNFVAKWKEQFSMKKSIADRYGNSKIIWTKIGARN